MTFTLVQKETHSNVGLKTLQQSSLPPGPGSLEKRDTKAAIPPHCSAASAHMKYLLRLKCLPAMQETWVQSLCQEDPLEKEMATHSSILAWRIPGTEEPGGLQSTGSQRIGHD